MADDLNDEWWQENTTNTEIINGSLPKLENKIQINDKLKKFIKKRKTEEEANSDSDKLIVRQAKKKKKKKYSNLINDKEEKVECIQNFLSVVKSYFENRLSNVEKDKLNLSKEHFFHANDMEMALSEYLINIHPDWDKLIKKKDLKYGSPLVLIICSSAIRAVDLNRACHDFRTKSCKVIKLFAKHMKLKDQSKLLENNVFHLAVGTPNRISMLIDIGSLNLLQTLTILIDWNWKDLKQRSIFNIPETRTDLFNLLQKHFIPNVIKQTSLKMALF